MLGKGSPSPFTLLGVPIDSVGGAGGTELSPKALRTSADWSRVTSQDLGDLSLHIRDRNRDATTGIIGSAEVLAATHVLRAKVGEIIRSGSRPILLGGCCAQDVGALAGARDAVGRVGLAYLDGHLDLYDGRTSPTGEAADMPLATMLGQGAAAWLEAAGGASLRPDDVLLVGPRDSEDAARRGSLMPEDFHPAIAHWPADQFTVDGAAKIAVDLRARLDGAGSPFWLAIDVDVLDQAAFPATDYLMPGGLGWAEFAVLVETLASSPRLLGLSIAFYSPEKDPGLGCGKRLSELVIKALEGAPA